MVVKKERQIITLLQSINAAISGYLALCRWQQSLEVLVYLSRSFITNKKKKQLNGGKMLKLEKCVLQLLKKETQQSRVQQKDSKKNKSKKLKTINCQVSNGRLKTRQDRTAAMSL